MTYTIIESEKEITPVSSDEQKIIEKTIPTASRFTIADKKQEIARIEQDIARNQERITTIEAEIAEVVKVLSLTIA